MEDISAIKRQYTCVQYARDVLGLNIKKSGDRTYSLASGHNPSCLSVHDDFWYDFKLGMGGDVIDLCAVAKHNGDKGKAIRELSGKSVSGKSASEWVSYTQNLCNLIELWHTNLRTEDLKYLGNRHIKASTISKLKIGYDGERLVIPYWKNGYIGYYATRDRGRGGAKYKKAKLDGMNENIAFGFDTLNRDSPVLVIAEGAFDALSFWQEGFKVLSPMGGHFNKDTLKQVISICKDNAKIFICFDNDGAGDSFQMAMAQTFFENKINFYCGRINTPNCKDVSDYYCIGGSLQELIKDAENGIDYLAKNIKDKEAFSAFSYKAGRFLSKPDMLDFFSRVPENLFGKVWLSAVAKSSTSAPADNIIVNELLTKYRLKFWEALGFFEYSGDLWRRRSDSEIQNYIQAALGMYKSGGRVMSIFRILKSVCVSTEELNKANIFCFQNGALELESGEFRNCREADLCSIRVNYEYDPNADCPLWRQFIEDVCEGDDVKEQLLSEVAGYVLFNSNCLQKCFFLLGNGANGKSVFLDTLASVFGRENVSNVEISGLIEPFQRISLMSSLVNICSETQSDVRGAESVFKQIVTGDTINGCYKGKDFVNFIPRAKFIVACNQFIRSKDITSGFMRRICFIKFNAKFSDNPGKGEYKADRNLTTKLQMELPGIFNWALEGYRVLCNTKQFSTPADEAETIEEFATDANPVVAFIQEEITSTEISKENLYKHYKDWAERNGHYAFGKISFLRIFKNTLKQFGGDYEEYRSNLGGQRWLQIVFNAEENKFKAD